MMIHSVFYILHVIPFHEEYHYLRILFDNMYAYYSIKSFVNSLEF